MLMNEFLINVKIGNFYEVKNYYYNFYDFLKLMIFINYQLSKNNVLARI